MVKWYYTPCTVELRNYYVSFEWYRYLLIFVDSDRPFRRRCHFLVFAAQMRFYTILVVPDFGYNFRIQRLVEKCPLQTPLATRIVG